MTGVFVLGMHRSGTSAVTRIVNLLGVPLGDPADLMQATPENPEGYWESLALSARNDEILDRFGGTWSGPPRLEVGWEKDPRLDPIRESARATFRAVYASPTWVWKDPRNCLTLPFWLDTLEVEPIIVLVWRNPLEVWRSLESRARMPKGLAVALWERYARSALEVSNGKPAFVVPYGGLLADPPRWGAALADFLTERGLACDWPGVASEAAAFLRPDLRHATYRTEDAVADADLSTAQRELVERFESGFGPHTTFESPRLPAETATTAPLLAERARGDLLERAVAARERELAATRAELTAAFREIGRLEGSTGVLLDWVETLASPAFPDASPLLEPSPLAYGLDAREDRDGYRAWLTSHAPRFEGERADLARRLSWMPETPRFSLLASISRTRVAELRASVNSLRAQVHGGWELCVSDDGTADRELVRALETLASEERRIRISRSNEARDTPTAMNRAFASATGDFVCPFELDATLEPEALGEIAVAIGAAVDFVYTDEDELDEAGERCRPFCKPDWSPDLVAMPAYPGRLMAIRRTVVDAVGGFRDEHDGAFELDLALRATERARMIQHVAKILYHGRPKPLDLDSAERALREAFERRGVAGEIESALVDGNFRLRRAVRGRPKVSVIIPLRDRADLLERCVRSVRETVGGADLQTILVDNRSTEPETLALLARLETAGLRKLEYPEPFNWAAINNRAAKEADGDLLLFLNNDVEARRPGWLEAMIAEAQVDDVGAVGARLLYPHGGVQHAGIVLGMGGVADHAFRHCPRDRPGYFGFAKTTRDVSAVTGACMMVRRSTFDDVGGFYENLPFTFNDIDLCLRLRARGLRVVYTPYAELVHHESVTRGLSRDLAEKLEMYRRWSAWIRRDPFFNPNLSLRRTEFVLRGADEVPPWRDLESMLEV